MGDEKKKSSPIRCFIMMPFTETGDYAPGHFEKVRLQIIEEAILGAGMESICTINSHISMNIIQEIYKGVTECEMAICDLSTNNPNVLYELGMRHAINKPVLVIKDEKTKWIFDTMMLNTIEYQSNRLFENVVDAVERISKALVETYDSKPSILEVANVKKVLDFKDSKINDMDKEEYNIMMLNRIANKLDQLENDNKYDSSRNNNDSSRSCSGMIRTTKSDTYFSENDLKRKKMLQNRDYRSLNDNERSLLDRLTDSENMDLSVSEYAEKKRNQLMDSKKNS